ncbi:DUF3352 domain-containing protein [Candidatus Sumerlaeota bacterium]|nr:DUF3352 domain-containing protein [Candidatus Sumerlaeota bacterium]
MKRFWMPMLVCVTLFALGYFTFWQPSVGYSAGDAPGKNPRFEQAAKHLDAGGTLYVYADVRDVLREFVQLFAQTMESEPRAQGALLMLDRAIDALGVYGVEDVAFSSLKVGHRYRHKAFLGIPGGRNGVLKLLGGKPHAFDLLDYAPVSTQLFSCDDLDFAGALPWIRMNAIQLAGPPAEAQLDMMLSQVKESTGVDLERFFDSIDGEIVVLAETDSARMITIEDAELAQPIEMAFPMLAVIFKTRHDGAYENIKAVMMRSESAQSVEQNGMKRVTLAQDLPNYPMTLSLAQQGEYCILASHQEYLDKILAAKQSGENLRSNPDFKELMAKMPEQGNGIYYISADFYQAINRSLDSFKNTMPRNIGTTFAFTQFQMYSAQLPALSSIGVRVNEPDGLYWIALDESRANQALISSISLPIMAVLAAMVVPNYMEYQVRAKVSRTRADQRSLATALEAFYIDNNQYPNWATGVDSINNSKEPSVALKAVDSMNAQEYSAWHLTSPIAYITRYPEDVFSTKGYGFNYYSDGNGWILWSCGPDKVLDLTVDNIFELYDPTIQQPSKALLNFSYDPTNGTRSGGDIIRVKQ